ncbi:MAG: hypothetical protein Athens071424_195 [Parcubacteria group bacterium Athens0714_24]|nr:MAG: hypothetical protein Athens071424_195 [Parcubacteria group bacterium Athens0714_24]
MQSYNQALILLKDLVLLTWNAKLLWIPIILVWILWKLWNYYIHSKYISNLNWSLLEIKLPREIYKGPRSMEMVLNMLHQTYDGLLWERLWRGFLRSWFSLEIVSIGGNIHFYIYAQKFFRNLVEAQIYAQYPDVEIEEVDDYTKNAFKEGFGAEWNCAGTEFVLSAEDAYPIKTYIDYGLHELLTKEEQKTDPLTAILEFMGSIKQSEQVWMQILVRATKKKWKDEGKKLIAKLVKEKEIKDKEGKVTGGISRMTSGEQDIIKAIERDVSKLGFDVGIRTIYFSPKDSFDAINFISLIGVMKQFNALNLNGFKPINTTGTAYLFRERRANAKKAKIIDAYRQRSYFYMPYDRKSFVLNTEELATIYHFPGRVAETPTLGRIEAKKGEAPTNLPV